MQELTANQRRQLIDTHQVFEAWRDAEAERKRRFTGSMRWLTRNRRDYLHRKIKKSERSLGPRSHETEAAYAAFTAGRAANADRLKGLQQKLLELAPINVAMGLGRMPNIAARIMRLCDEHGLLGNNLFLVGTNALFAYEARAGVVVDSGLVASHDIDLLLDARKNLSLVSTALSPSGGLIGLLRNVDASFALPRGRGYRAANRDGYMVDLIQPMPRDVASSNPAAGLTELPEDMEGAEIFGLDWLVNAPKLTETVIDDRGLPCRVVAVDPRVFALHKAWLSTREDREPVKARRDREQATAASEIATRYLHLDFNDASLTALPARLRFLAPSLTAEQSSGARTWHDGW